MVRVAALGAAAFCFPTRLDAAVGGDLLDDSCSTGVGGGVWASSRSAEILTTVSSPTSLLQRNSVAEGSKVTKRGSHLEASRSVHAAGSDEGLGHLAGVGRDLGAGVHSISGALSGTEWLDDEERDRLCMEEWGALQLSSATPVGQVWNFSHTGAVTASVEVNFSHRINGSSALKVGDGGKRTFGCETILSIGGPQPPVAKAWYNGVLAGNGRIYGIPFNANSVLEIDPSTQTVNTLAYGAFPDGLSKYKGGVLAANGRIYGIPYHADSVLEIDPQAGEARTFGHLWSQPFKFIGGVLSPNGLIYAIPYNADVVLEIDPQTLAVNTLGDLRLPGGTSAEKFVAGVLAPNGRIYGIPGSYPAVMEIDPVAKSVSVFGKLEPGFSKYSGGVLGSDGRIYGIPYKAEAVLVVDPMTRTVNTVGNVGSGCSKFHGGVLAPNGRIYGIPYNAQGVLEIDPSQQTVSVFGQLGPGYSKFTGGVLSSNGKIYAVPYNADGALEVDPITQSASIVGDLRAAFPQQVETMATFPKATSATYKFMGTVLADDGNMYGIPHSVGAVLRLGSCV